MCIIIFVYIEKKYYIFKFFFLRFLDFYCTTIICLYALQVTTTKYTCFKCSLKFIHMNISV